MIRRDFFRRTFGAVAALAGLGAVKVPPGPDKVATVADKPITTFNSVTITCRPMYTSFRLPQELLDDCVLSPNQVFTYLEKRG